MNGELQQNISFAEFELDSAHRQLWRDGKPLALYAKTFELLEFFVKKNGQILTKDEILETVWEGQFVEEANLSVQVSALRKALGETRHAPRFLVTIPGKGYKFVAEIENGNGEIVIEKHQFSRLIVEESEEVKSKKLKGKSSNSKRLYFYLLPFVFCLFAAFGGYWFFNRTNRGAEVPVIAAEKQPKLKKLTTIGRVNLAVLSPDGNFFAYSTYENGKYSMEIRLGQTNGNSDTTLVPKADKIYNPMAFSADGNWLYYVQSKPREFADGTLYKIPVLPGGVPQKLVSGINIFPAISPDEKHIAFIRGNRENKTSSIIIADLDGANERELVVRPAAQSIPSLTLAWSPDGSRIAFGAKSGKGNEREIFVADVATGNVAQITTHGWEELAKLDWLKDGSGLMMVGGDKDSVISTQIWQIDYPTGTAKKIISDLAKYGSALSFAADSDAFVVVQVNAESNIWVAPADNLKEAKQITFGSLFRQDGWYGLDWTADGRIVYSARIDRDLTLWTMDVNGENARQITPVGFQDKLPGVSADGQFVAFESNRSGKKDIWRVGLDGSNLTQMTNDGGNSNPSVTPDGQWIIFQHNGENGENAVRRLSASGGEAVNLTEKKTSSPRVSRDGKFIACGLSENSKMKLAIFPIEGGEPLKLFDLPPTFNFELASLRWSADGKFIAYRDWSNGIWQQSTTGGEPKLLEGLLSEKFYPFAWSLNGKQFAFTRGRDGRDAVLITDFK